jgi:hypothetical protein
MKPAGQTAISVWIARHTILLWLGVIVNAIFVAGLLFDPRWLLDLVGIPLQELIWARIAGGLLMIITVFYIPAAIDFGRYRTNAYLAVFPARTFGAVFFFLAVVLFGQPPGFLLASLVDALIGATTLYCLIRIKALEERANEAGVIR